MQDDRGKELREMRVAALALLERIQSADPADVQAAMIEYSALVDRFYRDHGDLVAEQQYEAAKKDFEYFTRLLALALAHSLTPPGS